MMSNIIKRKKNQKNIKSVMRKQKIFEQKAQICAELQVFIEKIISDQPLFNQRCNTNLNAFVGNDYSQQYIKVETQIKHQINHHNRDWTPQQTDILFSLFKKWGSKWTKISQQMKGRSQNCIKNRFYGNLRKVLRKMNKAARKLVKKFKKQLKFQSITRVIDASQGLFRLKSPLKQQSQYLTQKIISIAKKEQYQMTSQESEILIKQINKFNMLTRSYKSQKKTSISKNGKANTQKVFQGHSQTKQNQSSPVQSQILQMDIQFQQNQLSTHQQNLLAVQNQHQKKISIEKVDIIQQVQIQDDKIQFDHKQLNKQVADEIFISQIYSPLQFQAWI